MKLEDTLESHFRLTKDQKSALARLGLKAVRDLLFYFPARYSDISQIESLFEFIKKDYKITDVQKNIKKFKLSKRTKDTSMR
jgi:RecG-like helicase